MTIGAVATRDEIVGGQRKTDGYWKHGGALDIGSSRVVSRAGHPALTGAGVETIYQPGAGTIQVYNRDTQAYESLSISALNITLFPQSGGQLILPANCIGTSQLQGNAANGPVAGYQAAPPFSTTTTSTWVNTPISVSHTSVTGGIIRIEWQIDLLHSVLGAGFQVGIARDNVTQASLATLNAYQANYVIHVSGVWYTQPGAGTYTYTLQVNNLNPGTLQTYTGSFAMLWVTEQKR